MSSPTWRNFHSPWEGAARPHALVLALSDIKLAHSVFALPFAVLAAFMAAAAEESNWIRFSEQLALIVLCMFFARTWAMLVNRLADARFDRQNPRTARRVFATGSLLPRQGWSIALATGFAFILCCAAFMFFGNVWPLLFSVPVLAWIALYSYTKRYTLLCHIVLGSALAASPLAAAITINPSLFQLPPLGGMGLWPVPTPSTAFSISFLSAFVLFWVAGFDVAYALQDIDFDRRAGLHSIPAKLGAHGALWVSHVMHGAAFAFLFLAWRADPRFGPIMLSAVCLVGALLVFEHIVLARRGVAGLPLAFFTLNGIVSCVLGAAGILDVLI